MTKFPYSKYFLQDIFRATDKMLFCFNVLEDISLEKKFVLIYFCMKDLLTS